MKEIAIQPAGGDTRPAHSMEPDRVSWRKSWNIVRELAVVDFRKKYHDSTLGYFWSMLNPLSRFLTYYFAFNYIFAVKIPKFTLYLLLGVFFWNFFADATSSAISAVRSRAKLTKTIYFPRYLLVLASTLTALFSFTINTALLFLTVMITDHISPLQIFAIIPFILLVMFATGIGLVVAILFVHFRDISEIWGVCIALGFWLTPITYDPTRISQTIAEFVLLNPLARILVMLRAFLLFENIPPWTFMITTSLLCIGMLLIGYLFFVKYEHRIPEYV